MILHGSLAKEESQTSTEESDEKSVLEATKREYAKYRNDISQLQIDKKKLADEKKLEDSITMTDVIRFNVGGEIMMTTRKSLMVMSRSTLAKIFNGRWEEKLSHDVDTNIFLDFNPTLFRHLLEQLRQTERNPSFHFTPPHSSSSFAVRSFNRMLKIFGLDRSQSSSNEIIVMNVGGDHIVTRQKTLNSSQSTALISQPSQRRITNDVRRNGHFIDADPWLFRYLLGQLREHKNRIPLYFDVLSSGQMKSMNRMLKNFGLNRKSY